MVRHCGTWLLLVAALGGVTLSAQTPAPAFEVASIKRNVLGPLSLATLLTRPGGVLTATNQPLVRLIAFAYRVDDFRLIGGPNWIREARFDVEARANTEVSNAQLRLMMQSLLTNRFALVTHADRREMPRYALVLARDDGRLGPGIQPVDDCMSAIPSGKPNTYYGCGSLSVVGAIASTMLGAPVEDKSGVTGTYSVSVTFSPEGVRPFAGETFTPPADPNLPSFRDALRDQLGLKLEAGRGPVDVLVIDSVQQPTEN